jgi:hypothetical protein
VDCARGFVAHYDARGWVDELADAAVVPEVYLEWMSMDLIR